MYAQLGTPCLLPCASIAVLMLAVPYIVPSKLGTVTLLLRWQSGASVLLVVNLTTPALCAVRRASLMHRGTGR